MGKRPSIPQEEFERRIREKFGNKYDLSETFYVKAQDKVKIICPEHGPFYVTPNAMYRHRYGCRKCSDIITSERMTLTQDYFLEKCREVHGDTYDLSKAVYVAKKKKVVIGCKNTVTLK